MAHNVGYYGEDGIDKFYPKQTISLFNEYKDSFSLNVVVFSKQQQ